MNILSLTPYDVKCFATLNANYRVKCFATSNANYRVKCFATSNANCDEATVFCRFPLLKEIYG